MYSVYVDVLDLNETLKVLSSKLCIPLSQISSSTEGFINGLKVSCSCSKAGIMPTINAFCY